MNTKIITLVFISLFALIPVIIKADGGVTFSVEAPQIESDINLPSQEAIIFWDGNYETMMVSTGIKTKDLINLAWMIPVPSRTKPEVEKADAEAFKQVPYLFSEIKSRGRTSSLGTIIFLIFFSLFLIFLLLRKKRSALGLIGGGILIIILILFVASIFLVSLGGARSGSTTEIVPIDVIETKKVGIYDLVVLQATDAEYMVKWLNDQGYKISNESIPILQDYCNKTNFYFIVNKINKETLSQNDLLEGIAMPLKIKFQPEKPIYPLKMSSINGGKTVANVFFFSFEPYRDRSGTLLIKKSRETQIAMSIISIARNQEARSAMSYLYSMDEFMEMYYSVATWLHYEGDLKNLQTDAYFTFDSLTCDALSQNQYRGIEITKDECYKMLSGTTKDISFCEKIVNQSERDDCFTSFAVHYNKDISLCQKIADTSRRHSCYSDFVYNIIKDFSECEKLPYQDARDICFRMFANKGRDYSLCDKIIGINEKDSCFNDTSSYTKEPSSCEKIKDNSLRDDCFHNLAEKNKDSSLCEKVINKKDRDWCYEGVAWETRDISLCAKIEDKSQRDFCYTDVGRRINR